MSDPTAETYRPDDEEPVPWEEGSKRLAAADTYWLATVTAAGRAHLVPLLAVWVDEGLHFVASPATRKARDSPGIGTAASPPITTGWIW